MPLSLKDPETERLARDLAHRAGETITGATKKALEERLRRFRSEHEKTMLLDLAAIRHRFASLRGSTNQCSSRAMISAKPM